MFSSNKSKFNSSFLGIQPYLCPIKEINKANVAYEFQEAALEVVVNKTIEAAKSVGIDKIAIAGGVSANRRLRELMSIKVAENNMQMFMPEFILSTDNAAMIASAGYYRYINGVRHGLNLNAVPNLKMEFYNEK